MTATERKSQVIARAEFINIAIGIVERLLRSDGKCPTSFAREAEKKAREAGLL